MTESALKTPTDLKRNDTKNVAEALNGVLADSYGLRRADGTRLGPDDLYPRVIVRSRRDPSRAWVGTESGFAVLRREADGWQIAARHTDLQARIITLVESAPDTAWLGSDDRGLLRVRLAADPAQPPQVEHFDAQVGLSGPDAAVVSELGEAVYWSRSRKEIWHKGKTSGQIQRVVEIRTDCDQDALVVYVEQTGGGCCHTGRNDCFYRKVAGRSPEGGALRQGAAERQGWQKRAFARYRCAKCRKRATRPAAPPASA